ncbi:MAG: pilus assembly protein PilM [Planctomycetes bacterium]|nr:pilus assembly protein PilM [Planctomycetota bacterium]
MAYGLDVGVSLSALVGLTRKGSTWRLKHALVLPGFRRDPESKPELYSDAPLGSTWRALKSLGVRPAAASVLVSGRDVFYRFTPSGTDPRMVERQVQLEADELSGDEGRVLAGHIGGCDYDYSPVIHIGLARENVIDHFAGCLRAMGIDGGPMVPGCAALFSAYKVAGDTDSEATYLMANVGDDNTDVILVREGSLLYCRTIGVGVEDFIARLLPEYGGDRDAVRRVLFNEIDLRPAIAADNLSQNRGVEGGQEVAARLFQQITSTIMLAKSAHKAPKLDAAKILLCGPGAGIPGLRELMMNRTRKQVEIFDPLANVEVEGVNDRTRETIAAYGPALTLAVGLARINTDRHADRILFLPGSLRKRREFLNKSLFLYLAAATVLALLIPLYLLSRNAAASADDDVKRRQQAPIGRYLNASKEIEIFKKANDRAKQRADAAELATAPGHVSTQVLVALAQYRPDSVRIRSAVLETSTLNPGSDKNFVPKSVLKMSFFIEAKEGADPTKVKDQLRDILKDPKKFPGIKAVVPGAATAVTTPPGLNVEYSIELDLGVAMGAPAKGGA